MKAALVLGFLCPLVAIVCGTTGCGSDCGNADSSHPSPTPSMTFSQATAHLAATVSKTSVGIGLSFKYDDVSVCPIFQGSATLDGARMNFADGEQGVTSSFYGHTDCSSVSYTCGPTEFFLPTASLPSAAATGSLQFVVSDSGGSEHITVDASSLTVATCDFASCSSSD